MPKRASITPWARHRLLAAREVRERGEAAERQVIREICTSGDADPTAVAEVLGVKNRQRIYTILNEASAEDHEPKQPYMPAIVYLRGAGCPQEEWDAIENALLWRGWATTKDRKRAWALARGGLDVVFLDFSATAGGKPREEITVGLTKATYKDEMAGTPTEQVLKRVSGGKQPRPRRDGELDVHAIAHLVAEELLGSTQA